MRVAEKEKKKIAPNSVHTRPGQENLEKNSKKIEKIKKPLSGIIFSQNGMPRKREKNFSPDFRSYLTRARKLKKNSKKIKKPLSGIIFSHNGKK